MPVYAKFETLLQERNLTAYQVAKDTGIPSSTFTDWKKGKSCPKTEKLQILANYFEIKIEDFLERTD